MIHVFQPADQFILSGLKKRSIEFHNDDIYRKFTLTDFIASGIQ